MHQINFDREIKRRRTRWRIKIGDSRETGNIINNKILRSIELEFGLLHSFTCKQTIRRLKQSKIDRTQTEIEERERERERKRELREEEEGGGGGLEREAERSTRRRLWRWFKLSGFFFTLTPSSSISLSLSLSVFPALGKWGLKFVSNFEWMMARTHPERGRECEG